MAFWRLYNVITYKSTKFGVKLGLTAGTIYYVSEQGVWRDSETTLELYKNITSNLSPYTKEITKQIPFEFPSLPQTNEVSYLMQHYWNRGVMASFSFLANIPNYVSDYAAKGFNALLDTTEVKKQLMPQVETKN